MDPLKQPELEPAVYAPLVPVLYADGIANLSPGNQVVKLHLVRYDNPVYGDGDARIEAVAQVVLPIEGFVNTLIFFERVLTSLVEDGHVKQELVDRLRNAP